MTSDKSGPRYDPVGQGFPVLPDAKEQAEARPMVIELTPEDIAVMYKVMKLTPNQFTQELLGRFREAGAAVEGTAPFLRLAHGALYRVKDPFRFRYMWLPAAYQRGVEIMGGCAS